MFDHILMWILNACAIPHVEDSMVFNNRSSWTSSQDSLFLKPVAALQPHMVSGLSSPRIVF